MVAQVTQIRAEIEKFADDILSEAIGMAIAEVVGKCEARLTARIAALEERLNQSSFKGAWSEREFKKGNIVTQGGAIYYCCADRTDTRPGVGGDWVLMIPRARDGRDYVPPDEPRTVRAARASGSSQPVAVRSNNK